MAQEPIIFTLWSFKEKKKKSFPVLYYNSKDKFLKVERSNHILFYKWNATEMCLSVFFPPSVVKMIYSVFWLLGDNSLWVSHVSTSCEWDTNCPKGIGPKIIIEC